MTGDFKLHPGAFLNCREDACCCNKQDSGPGVCECGHPCGEHLPTSGLCTRCKCEDFKWAKPQEQTL